MRPRQCERGAGRPPFLFLFAAALAAAVLAGGAAALAASDQSHLSTDPEVVRAREAVRAGRLDEALEILRPLSPKRPDGADILFLRGLAALTASQRPGTGADEAGALLGEAVAAFRTILLHRPGFARVRLELARAHFLQGEDTIARRHFEQVLAGRPAPVVGFQRPALPSHHAGAAALAGPVRGRGRSRQQRQRRLRHAHDLARHPLRAPPLPAPGRHRAQVRARGHRVGRRRVPAPGSPSACGCAPGPTSGCESTRAGPSIDSRFPPMSGRAGS